MMFLVAAGIVSETDNRKIDDRGAQMAVKHRASK